MLISIVYDLLLFLMLFVLFMAGKGLRRNGVKILSWPGLVAILIFTLNEGLRFGRGIDYNHYWLSYESLAATGESRFEYGFEAFANIAIYFGLPFQGFVILMSLLFIFATLFLLKNYGKYMPWVLMLFVLFSLKTVENMVRWYTAFSFVMIGLYFQIKGDSLKPNKYFVFFSAISCFFHLAILPIPIIFYAIYFLKRPILPPFISIGLFIAVGLFFQTSFMEQFADTVNTLSTVSDKFEKYGDKAVYWLTSGFRGIEKEGMPGIQDILLLSFIAYYGHKVLSNADKPLLYAYNLFIVGMILYPIARQIELAVRYQQVFFFFRAIVLSAILFECFRSHSLKIFQPILLAAMLILLNVGRKYFTEAFTDDRIRYMYVWDKQKKHTADYILSRWRDGQDKAALKRETEKRKKKK